MLEDIDDVPAMSREETMQALYGGGDTSGDERDDYSDDPFNYDEDHSLEVARDEEGESGEKDESGEQTAQEPVAATANRAYAAAKPDIFITGAARRTRPLMTKFENAALIGERATHIEQGATDLSDAVVSEITSRGITRALDIAEVEINTPGAKIPLEIHRRIAPNVYEVWSPEELLTLDKTLCESYSHEATALLSQINGGECERGLEYPFMMRKFMKNFEAPRHQST